MNNNYIHPQFKLNGVPHTVESLKHEALLLLQSPEEHLRDLGQLIGDWLDEKKHIVQRTSGTTGPPKEIELNKMAMIASAEATVTFFDVRPGSKALLCMSTQFVGGKLMFIRALLFGWELDVCKPSACPLAHTATHYNFVAMVPMQVENSLKEMNQIDILIIGGAKVSPVLAQKLLEKNTQVYETYGMTETITHIAAKKIGTPYFEVLPHANIQTDERGCLVIHAPAINPNPIVTNDLVQLINNRTFEWLGRFDNVINSGGVKLFPEQIEQKLADKIKSRFFIGGKADDYFGTIVVLVIESEPYTLDEDVFEGLAKYERPKEIQFVEQLIETESGKVIRSKNIN
ncbi:AMP-binding protein [Myroides sp. 1354]|uniref:AMP-binding protein n=1 Tax=unclassified Myroides TaxID=2642485 RepID=UPI002574DE8C|nr:MULTISPECIES: AMP-binding protein [unclassified Myroides]MDM1045094.1 AMP-binding protein [Myroides sp. R163-1]MDM1055976.1 AMP-binding protein [Myroides sp. 1354]MDM1069075.1 AMP-binding protein [Myroides sp. 1372]